MLLASVEHHSWQFKTSVGVQTARGEGSDEMNCAKGQKTPLPALLFSLFEEELGGTWPDRPGDVRPQERVQRRTVGRSSTPLSPCRCLILLCRWWQNSWWTSPSWRRWRGKRTRRWSGSRTSFSRVPLSQLQTRRLGWTFQLCQ